MEGQTEEEEVNALKGKDRNIPVLKVGRRQRRTNVRQDIERHRQRQKDKQTSRCRTETEKDKSRERINKLEARQRHR